MTKPPASTLSRLPVIALIVLLTACGATTTTSPAATSSVVVSSPREAEEGWSYDDQAAWEIVDGEYQSPIDIETDDLAEDDDYRALNLDYSDAKVTEVEDNHHTIKATVEAASTKINGREFTLEQFHFHAQSEHTVDGKHFPMEIHFVHEASDGRYAVVGVFITEGAKNPAFGEVLDSIGSDPGQISLATLVPSEADYFHYLGSLTTPPLTENVEWYVMQQPIEASAEQIEKFTGYYSHNNRDVQELDDRRVIEYDA